MRWRVLTTVLILVFLVSAVASLNFHLPGVSLRSHDDGMATKHVPNEVQMDRDCADVPRTQMSSAIGSILPPVEVAPIAAERFDPAVLTARQPAAIIKEQHVFRI
jgi:hypothetical protein